MIRARVTLPTSVSALPEALAAAGVADGTTADALVFGPTQDNPSSWPEVRAMLATCFTVTKEAAEAGAPIAYLISQPALLGARGPCPGMLAGALVSGVRAMAMEGRRSGLRINGLTYDDHTDADVFARWVRVVLELDGASGDIIHLGSHHHGKVRP